MKKNIWAIFWCITTLVFSSAHAVEKTIIVLDASGSMWGQIEGKTKMDIAKNTLREVVSEWDSKKPLGLMAYGHRNKGDCADIEVIVPISKVNKSRFLEKIESILPKGKTPISQSLQRAAKALRHNEDKATIILISDGQESCNADPCSTAKTLKKQGIDFVTHVVGFNVDKTTDSQLACIAKATGGEYFSANDAQSLNSALKNVVKTVQNPKKIKKNQVIIHLLDKPNGKKLNANHNIYSKKVLAASCESSPQAACIVNLETGDYTMSSSIDGGSVTSHFLVNKGKTEVNAVLNSGKITLSASDGKGNMLDAHHSITGTDKNGQSREINSCISKQKEPCVQELSTGQYTIYSRFGELIITTPLTIKLGENQKINIVLATGRLTLSASKNGHSVEAHHSIGGVDADGNNIEVTSCSSHSSAPCILELPTGKYDIESTYFAEDDTRQDQNMPLTLQAGDTQQLNIAF